MKHSLDDLKDLAAAAWHKKKRGKTALADVFDGGDYEKCFKLHEIAFISGYRAASKKARRKAVRR